MDAGRGRRPRRTDNWVRGSSLCRQGCAEVRFFTPRQEIDACGHVTVAIATALAETGTWDPGKAAVQAAGGSYDLLLRHDDHGVIVEMRRQLQHFEPLDPAPNLASILGPASDIVAASHRFKVGMIGVWAFDAGDQTEVRVRMRDLCAAIGAVEEPGQRHELWRPRPHPTTSATRGFVLSVT